MTPTLTHPPAEDLGRFVEGTLDDAERPAIVAHIADCDECRIVVVDVAEFVEPVTVHSERRWWMSAAAAIVITLGGTFAWQTLRNPLTPVIEASSHLRSRSVDGRLSGFTYVERSVARGDGDEELDTDELQLDGKIAAVLEQRGNDPKTLHAKGVALLVMPKAKVQDRDKAVSLLLEAVAKAPNKPAILSDLAAALIAKGDAANLKRAVGVCDRALQLSSHSPEVLFNRAKALELLGQQRQAITAYDRYLAVDASSEWAKEATQRRDILKSLLPPS
jgi:hypothetical protein